MMFLSKLQFKPSPECYRLIASNYQIHRTVMSGFPDEKGMARQNNNVLYVVCDDSVLVQSETKPNWADKKFHADVKQFDVGVKSGKIFNFVLTANPVVRQNKKCRAITEEKDLVRWIVKKGKQHGFTICSLSIGKPSLIQFKGKTGKQTHNKVVFKGKLKITSTEDFSQTIRKGIGKGKSFGFGMLLLSR